MVMERVRQKHKISATTRGKTKSDETHVLLRITKAPLIWNGIRQEQEKEQEMMGLEIKSRQAARSKNCLFYVLVMRSVLPIFHQMIRRRIEVNPYKNEPQKGNAKSFCSASFVVGAYCYVSLRRIIYSCNKYPSSLLL